MIDLGSAANFGKLQLQASIDSLTGVVLQTRTGIVPDPKVYYRKTEIFQGEERAEEPILPIGEPEAAEAYFSLRVADRGAIEDNVVEWSPWSAPYESFDGNLLSPGNRRYVQFRLLFSSEDARQSAVVENLNFEFSTPTLADELIAEISPGEVTLGESHAFDYYIRSAFAANNDGFDRIEIATPFASTVSEVNLDGVPIDFSVENTDRDHLSIQLTQNRISESGQLLHIRLNGLVTVYGTTFFAKVFDSQKDELGQDVVAGDASPEGESDRLSVQGQLRNELVLDLDVNVPAFSPNGDGINDNLRISYILLRALQEVRVDLSLYDLSGSLVRRLQDAGAINGPQRLQWDGRDNSGSAVPPGLYLLRLSVETDTGVEEQARLVGVAYNMGRTVITYRRLSRCLKAILGIVAATQTSAEQISFNTPSAWREWRYPQGAVEISPFGAIRPLEVRKGIDAMRDAAAFGGGVRAVGSGANSAQLVMDGDPTTGWQPDPEDPSDTWWIEVDLRTHGYSRENPPSLCNRDAGYGVFYRPTLQR